MTHTATREMENAIFRYLQVPAHIDAIGSLLLTDLYHGPFSIVMPDGGPKAIASGLELYGFGDEQDNCVECWGTLLPILSAWCEDISTLYYEEDSGWIGDREPQGYFDDHEPCMNCDGEGCDQCGETGKQWWEPNEYYRLERREVLRALFGELASYV